MANSTLGNTIYVDATGTLTTAKNTLVTYIVVTATAASAILELSDPSISTNGKKMDLRVATSGASQVFDFSRKPVNFPNGISVTTLTNAKAVIMTSTAGGG